MLGTTREMVLGQTANLGKVLATKDLVRWPASHGHPMKALSKTSMVAFTPLVIQTKR